MWRFLRWTLRLVAAATVALACLTAGLWVATSGTYAVPSLVTDDHSLPSARIEGHRLHLRVFDGPAGGGTVIVLHGGPGGDFRSLLALSALSETHRVVFYEQRGAGLSERAEDGGLMLDGYLNELAAVVAHVAPDGPVTLIGHSWGAMLAAAYLERAPEQVAGLVLIEPGYLDAAGREAWQRESRRYMSGPDWWTKGLMAGFRAARVTGPDAEARADFLVGQMVRAFVDHPQNPYHCGDGYAAPGWRFGARASAAWDGAPAAEVNRIGAAAASFAGPVLFVAGACNGWMGPALQSAHAARFANADMVEIPQAGHDVVWDNPDATLAAIRDWLNRHPARP